MLSDDVDRAHRICTYGFATANPDRLAVHCAPGGRWCVYRGHRYWGDYTTHAEAIAAAQTITAWARAS